MSDAMLAMGAGAMAETLGDAGTGVTVRPHGGPHGRSLTHSIVGASTQAVSPPDKTWRRHGAAGRFRAWPLDG